MDRIERTSQKVEELFHQSAAGADGTDGEFMQILQRYIFGELCYTGSLDNRMRELVTITVLTAIQALPQLKGFGFGTLTFALFLGFLPSYLGAGGLGPWALAGVALLSLGLLWLGLGRRAGA